MRLGSFRIWKEKNPAQSNKIGAVIGALSTEFIAPLLPLA